MNKPFKGILLNCRFDPDYAHILGTFYDIKEQQFKPLETLRVESIRKAKNAISLWVVETINSIYSVSEADAINLKKEFENFLR